MAAQKPTAETGAVESEQDVKERQETASRDDNLKAEPAKLPEPTGEKQAVHARSLQTGANVDGPVTTKQPRGLNEPPADSVAPDLGVE